MQIKAPIFALYKKYIMIELKEYEGIKYASAKEIFNALGQRKSNFTQWIRIVLLNKPFIENQDFTFLKMRSTGGRPGIDYLLTKETAISVIMISGGVKAHEIRMQVINAFKEKQSGILLNVDQVSALTDMVKTMTLVSVQKDAEKNHYKFKNFKKSSEWWSYRAELLGYSTQSLKDALANIGKKYSSQKKALIHIEPSEIIRTGVIDLLVALGRNEEYAINIAEFAKVIAEKNNYHLQIWDDTKPNPLNLNEKYIIERQKIDFRFK